MGFIKIVIRMVKQIANKKGTKTGKKSTLKFTIDCKLPIEDNVIVLKDFSSFLEQRIKVDNKTGNLGTAVTVSMDKESIVVESKIPFSKRYLKEFLRVIAVNKNTYALRYFKINNEEAAE